MTVFNTIALSNMGKLEGLRNYFLVPPSVDSPPPSPNTLSRRRVLGIGSGIAATPFVVRGMQIAEFLGVGATELDTPLLRATSQHTSRSLAHNHLVVAGDSIGAGYWDDRQPVKSSGEFVTDFMNNSKGLGARWDCTVTARNGAVIDDIFGQFAVIPSLVKGEPDVDLILSIGGNDFRAFLETKKPEALEVYKNPPSLLWNRFDMQIGREMGRVTHRYRTEIAPGLRQLRLDLAAQGTQLNRVVLVNLPNMANSNYDLETQDASVPTIRYRNVSRNTDERGSLLERLGRSVTGRANRAIDEALWSQRHMIGTEMLGLNAYGLHGDDLLGYHPTRDGQRLLAVDYLVKTFTPPDHEVAPNVSLLAAAETPS